MGKTFTRQNWQSEQKKNPPKLKAILIIHKEKNAEPEIVCNAFFSVYLRRLSLSILAIF